MKEQAGNILIIEDEPSLNEAYSIIVSSAGHRVKAAFNGKEALGIVAEWQPDVILLDLRMPVMDGIAFLSAYKPLELPKKPAIVIFSNFDMQKEIDEAYKLGADRYILKSWASPREVLQIVSESLMPLTK